MSRQCKIDPHSFCYICGQYLMASQKCSITEKISKAYELYFQLKSNNGSQKYIPNFCCQNCRTRLLSWMKGTGKSMLFSTPMIWREQSDHISDCYFCTVKTFGFSKAYKSRIEYPTCSSVSRPIPHDDDHPVPISPGTIAEQSSDDDMNEVHEVEQDAVEAEVDSLDEDRPLLLNQARLNELVCALDLGKAKAELLASRLAEWNLLESGTKISLYRNRQKEYVCYFDSCDGLHFCCDIEGLMLKLDLKHDPNDWRLFIDSSKSSLKAVLLHIGNKYPSIPIGYSRVHKESYENIKFLLEKVDYIKYKWLICSDLKVVALVTGMQGGYTKYMCFLCQWDSRDKSSHFKKKIWPLRKIDKVGQYNVKNVPLVEKRKIILPPLHIKLGIMKAFVKGMDINGPGFLYLKNKFPHLSNEKIKEGVFVGPDIRKLIKDGTFDSKLNVKELEAWNAFKDVISDFLGNNKSKDYKELVEHLLQALNDLGSNMSLKLHLLHSHLNFFPENLGDYSDEHGERFHQTIATFEKRYLGKPTQNMLADFIWYLVNTPAISAHNRKSPGSVSKRPKQTLN